MDEKSVCEGLSRDHLRLDRHPERLGRAPEISFWVANDTRTSWYEFLRCRPSTVGVYRAKLKGTGSPGKRS
jgi:hypothetical protein